MKNKCALVPKIAELLKNMRSEFRRGVTDNCQDIGDSYYSLLGVLCLGIPREVEKRVTEKHFGDGMTVSTNERNTQVSPDND